MMQPALHLTGVARILALRLAGEQLQPLQERGVTIIVGHAWCGSLPTSHHRGGHHHLHGAQSSGTV
eukprot:SAG25_NODE_256_length_10933_cov_24.263522_11_plen_66_part_00